jgi:hypothetical protein
MAKPKKSKAGRKKIADKATRLVIFPRESWLKAVGIEEAKKTAMDAIESKAKKKMKN